LAQAKKIEAKKANAYEKIPTCAYARVSTDSRKQEESLENQISTYERVIKNNPTYEFMGVYADQGITGIFEKRPQFQEMLEEVRKGNIKLIITKSISRFARNTVTVLSVARELKELGVGIFFEEQNINTLSEDGEVMLSVLSSFYQEESRSQSENNKLSIRKRFARGEGMINTTCFLGYDKNEYGELVINHKEVLVVRLIFGLTANGVGMGRIISLLNEMSIKTVRGGKWANGVLKGMISNEKYKGDFHIQKYYTPSNKMNQTVLNRGEVQSYYITDNHPPVVSKELWKEAQEGRERRKRSRNIGKGGMKKYQNRYLLGGLLKCPLCRMSLRRAHRYKGKVWWICSTYLTEGKSMCKGVAIDDVIVTKENITEPTVVEEVIVDGKKHYRYTSEARFNSGERGTEHEESESGSILPSVHRPRRTVIKL